MQSIHDFAPQLVRFNYRLLETRAKAKNSNNTLGKKAESYFYN